jgi:hypothetical protein
VQDMPSPSPSSIHRREVQEMHTIVVT